MHAVSEGRAVARAIGGDRVPDTEALETEDHRQHRATSPHSTLDYDAGNVSPHHVSDSVHRCNDPFRAGQ